MLVFKSYTLKKLFILGILGLISLILIAFLKFNFKNEDQIINNFKSVQNGDLVLRCGRSMESYAVYVTDSNSEFSHIGIISIENSIPFVIHAVPTKDNHIKKEKLNEFLNSENCSHFGIYRSNFSLNTLNNVVNEAQSFVAQKIEFDNDYNLETDSKLYCTELILKAFKNAGIPLKIEAKEIDLILGKHAIILPSEFTKSPFYIVKI